MPRHASPVRAVPDKEEEEEYSVEKVVRLFFEIFLTDSKNLLLFDVHCKVHTNIFKRIVPKNLEFKTDIELLWIHVLTFNGDYFCIRLTNTLVEMGKSNIY